MYQMSSESPELYFYRRYYEKQFGLIFPDTLYIDAPGKSFQGRPYVQAQ